MIVGLGSVFVSAGTYRIAAIFEHLGGDFGLPVLDAL
jgi:hypothetical protein